MDIIHKIARTTIAFILTLNIIIFGYIAWPTGMTSLEIESSGMQVVIAAVNDAITAGEIYKLDIDRPVIQSIIRLDSNIYSQAVGHLVLPKDNWKAYVITGEFARKLENETHSLAFTDSLNRVIIFLAVPGANPAQIISHEFIHVLQTDDDFRIIGLPRVEAEYEAELVSRMTVSLLPVTLQTYPVYGISKIEKLKIRKYLALNGL